MAFLRNLLSWWIAGQGALPGYPLHVSFPVWAADNEVESGEAEAEEVP